MNLLSAALELPVLNSKPKKIYGPEHNVLTRIQYEW
jgi:hypothetical protein